MQEEQDRLEERLRTKIEILRNNDEIVIEVGNRNVQIFVVTLHLNLLFFYTQRKMKLLREILDQESDDEEDKDEYDEDSSEDEDSEEEKRDEEEEEEFDERDGNKKDQGQDNTPQDTEGTDDERVHCQVKLGSGLFAFLFTCTHV